MAPSDPEAPRPRRIPAVARDVLLVTLGAVLAVAAEEWRDARATKRRVDVAVSSVHAEITDNLARVQRAAVRHKATADSLQAYVDRHAVPSDRLLFSGVFNPAHTHATAWQTARDTRALGDIPYAVALRLGALYEEQESYARAGDALDASMATRIMTDGVKSAFLDRWTNLIFLNMDFAGRAQNLGERYKRTLAFMDSLNAPKPK